MGFMQALVLFLSHPHYQAPGLSYYLVTGFLTFVSLVFIYATRRTRKTYLSLGLDFGILDIDLICSHSPQLTRKSLMEYGLSNPVKSLEEAFDMPGYECKCRGCTKDLYMLKEPAGDVYCSWCFGIVDLLDALIEEVENEA
jgi:hypothetical protein